jgi:hypothetical protein
MIQTSRQIDLVREVFVRDLCLANKTDIAAHARLRSRVLNGFNDCLEF